jgi:WD40 repeat protein
MPLQASAMMDDDQNETGRMPMSVFDISRKGLNALAVAPDGTRLATAARDGVVRIHDLTNGALLASFRVRARHALVLHQHTNTSVSLCEGRCQTACASAVYLDWNAHRARLKYAVIMSECCAWHRCTMGTLHAAHGVRMERAWLREGRMIW